MIWEKWFVVVANYASINCYRPKLFSIKSIPICFHSFYSYNCTILEKHDLLDFTMKIWLQDVHWLRLVRTQSLVAVRMASQPQRVETWKAVLRHSAASHCLAAARTEWVSPKEMTSKVVPRNPRHRQIVNLQSKKSTVLFISEINNGIQGVEKV